MTTYDKYFWENLWFWEKGESFILFIRFYELGKPATSRYGSEIKKFIVISVVEISLGSRCPGSQKSKTNAWKQMLLFYYLTHFKQSKMSGKSRFNNGISFIFSTDYNNFWKKRFSGSLHKRIKTRFSGHFWLCTLRWHQSCRDPLIVWLVYRVASSNALKFNNSNNDRTNSNSIVCLVVNENIQVRSVEWISKIHD